MVWNSAVLVAIITTFGVLGGAFVENGTGVLCEVGITECKPDQAVLDSRNETITDLRDRLDKSDDERRTWQDKYTALLEDLAGVKAQVASLSESFSGIEQSTRNFTFDPSFWSNVTTNPRETVNLCDANPMLCGSLDDSRLMLRNLSTEIIRLETR